MESNSDKKFNKSNLDKGLQLVREGNLHQADICFDAEMTQSNRPDFNVFVHHGHLLNRLGRYEEAIAKFNSFLNNHPDDVSCLFGKGISNMGLLKLDDALELFKKVIGFCPSHAEAYFFSAMIYCYPLYQNYDLNNAKDFYDKYQKLRKDFFINNPDYFDLLGDDLSIDNLGEYYDKIHNFYNLSDLFMILNQLLERECADNSIEYSYKKFKLLNDDEKEVGDLFKISGYDENLINDLDSKNKLTIEDKRTLNKIMDSFKNSDLPFKDLNDLIRLKVLDKNEPIDSFYQNLENYMNSLINENDRKLNRVEDENEKLKNEIVKLTKKINSLVNTKVDKKWDLDNQINIKEKEMRELEAEKLGLKEEIQGLEEEKRKLSNQINNIYADKLDNEPMDNNISIFGDDFKNANSMNMISGINYEDYQKDLDLLVSEGDITKEEYNIFESAFKEYYAGNFNEAYEHFNEFSGNFKFQQEYINFLKATSLSSDNKFKEAYERFLGNLSKNKLRDKYNKDKYPILWFNFGNIYFDYGISQSGKKAIDTFSLAVYCYKNAKEIVAEKKSKSKSKSNYKFNFKDSKSKKDFEKNVQMMSKRVAICKNLLEIEELKHEMSKEDFEKNVQMMSKRVAICKKLYENEKNLLEIEELKQKKEKK